MRRYMFTLLLLLTVAGTTSAQFLGTVSYESGYSDNMFSTSLRTPAATNDATLMLGYFPDDANWAVNYTGALSTFVQFPDRLYTTHGLGGSYGLPYGENGRNNLSLLVTGALRTDREDYAMYDYRQALASLSAKHYVLQNLFAQASLQSRYRTYPNFGELGYLEHVATLGTMVFFETRTSIRVQAEAGFKNYSSTVNTALQAASQFSGSNSGFTKGTVDIDGGGPGSGGGGGGNGGGGKGSGGSGWGGQGSGGMGMNQNNIDPSVSYLMYDDPSTSQLRLWMNIGQALGEQTGVSLRLQQRLNLTQRGRAFVGGSVDLIGEEELFDDPYSYEGSEATFTVTQLLPWEMRIQTAAFFMLKNYAYAANLEAASSSGALRQDDRFGGWIEITKALGGEWLVFNGLELSMQYVYLRNQSNTAWYDYSSNSLGFSISTDF